MGKALTLHINYGPGAGVKDVDLEWNGDTPDAAALLTILDRVIPWKTPIQVALAEAGGPEGSRQPSAAPEATEAPPVEPTRCARLSCGHPRRMHQADNQGWGGCLECGSVLKCRSYVGPLPKTTDVRMGG